MEAHLPTGRSQAGNSTGFLFIKVTHATTRSQPESTNRDYPQRASTLELRKVAITRRRFMERRSLCVERLEPWSSGLSRPIIKVLTRSRLDPVPKPLRSLPAASAAPATPGRRGSSHSFSTQKRPAAQGQVTSIPEKDF